MRIIYLKNFRRGLATNSSSTHSLIYRNEDELFKDLNIFECNYYDRCTNTIAASRDAKIKYILADIMWNSELVEVLSAFYPEMKQYYPLVKQRMKDMGSEAFGMYVRGRLDFPNNIQASVDYIRNIIEDDDVIIVGGSDEPEFVYDTTNGHVKCSEPEDVEYFGKYKNLGVTKNGNYWVGYGDTDDRVVVHDGDTEDDEYYDPTKHAFCGRIRYMTEQGEPIPEFPELIDIRITNKCDHGCKQCFMDSNMHGKHADIKFLKSVIDNCGNANETKKHRVEFSIGGGNVLLYPHFEEFLKEIKKNGHIANVTINIKDCKTILASRKLVTIFRDLVDGIGVSIESPDDIPVLKKFYGRFHSKDNEWPPRTKYIVAHIIPEYLGVEKTVAILNGVTKTDMYVPVLMLGYKTNGRGENCDWTHFTCEELDEIFRNRYSVEIDTTFANRYFDWIDRNFSYKHSITLNEGEYSMYIDGVEEKAYKSSYQLKKPYEINPHTWGEQKIEDVFAKIRMDGGFAVYNPDEHKYWSNAK